MARLVVPVILGAVLLLPPLAQASPPDQTWIGGLYDDADHDVVVIAVTSLAAIEAPPISTPARTSIVVALVPATSEAQALEPPRLTRSCRAPPSALRRTAEA